MAKGNVAHYCMDYKTFDGFVFPTRRRVVARGEADIYLRLPTRADYREKIWDHAAGALIVTEAGGVVTDISGRPLEFHHGRELANNRGVIVTNGPLHSRVIEAIQSLGIGAGS